MTPAIASVVASPPAAFLPQPVVTTPQASSPQDVQRLQALIANIQPAGETVGPATATMSPTVTKTETGGFTTLGDSILQGVAKFNSGYNESLDNINKKLQEVSNPVDLSNNFGDIMELQIEVARWSMSVMGVDNASKAGTNTIKELSKGG